MKYHQHFKLIITIVYMQLASCAFATWPIAADHVKQCYEDTITSRSLREQLEQDEKKSSESMSGDESYFRNVLKAFYPDGLVLAVTLDQKLKRFPGYATLAVEIFSQDDTTIRYAFYSLDSYHVRGKPHSQKIFLGRLTLTKHSSNK